MNIKKYGSAEWTGTLKEGSGVISTESGVLDKAQYGFNKRFEDEPGTNPEELIGAAHASCFSMAFSNELGKLDVTADKIETRSDVTLEKNDNGFEITKAHLTVTASAEGATEEVIREAANNAKTGCPVSKLLNAEVTMDLTIN